MELYAIIKQAIADDTGLANSLLHIHGGLAIFLLARLVTGRALGSFVPFLCVFVLQCVTEAIDYSNHGWRSADTVSDMINTLFWPLVLTVAVKLRPIRASEKASE